MASRAAIRALLPRRGFKQLIGPGAARFQLGPDFPHGLTSPTPTPPCHESGIGICIDRRFGSLPSSFPARIRAEQLVARVRRGAAPSSPLPSADVRRRTTRSRPLGPLPPARSTCLLTPAATLSRRRRPLHPSVRDSPSSGARRAGSGSRHHRLVQGGQEHAGSSRNFTGSSAKMATRLLIQKFSRMSMSSSLLGAHASAAAPEGVFQGAAVHPGMTAPSKPAIHCYAARYFNVFPCSHADAKTSLTTTGMPSTITNCMKPSFLDFSGVKKTFSSSASKSNNHKFATQAKMAALRAQDAARKPLSEIEQSRKDTDTTIALMAFTCLCILYMSANDNRSTDNGSSRCSNCCNCQCHGPNPKVQQD